MDYLLTFSIIALAALIHASFQLGISMVTLLSGHAAGRSAPRGRSLGLIGAFLFGTLVMTSLIISTISYVSSSLFHQKVPTFAWSAACGVMIAIGIAVWTFYYRRGSGTSLWCAVGTYLHYRPNHGNGLFAGISAPSSPTSRYTTLCFRRLTRNDYRYHTHREWA